MRFWDASGLTPLLLPDEFTSPAQALAATDAHATVWWASRVECASAIARREREGSLSAEEAERAWARLRAAASTWDEVGASERVREAAERMLRVHPLCAADALQLAAAWVCNAERQSYMEFVTFDDRLAEAARREGFRVCATR
ncbi:MAG: hypothetical protein ACRD0Y_03825 [Terriglobales bacterium]